jgi:hypothetical protein
MDIYAAVVTTVGLVSIGALMFGTLALHYWLESRGKELILWTPITLMMFAFIWFVLYQTLVKK